MFMTDITTDLLKKLHKYTLIKPIVALYPAKNIKVKKDMQNIAIKFEKKTCLACFFITFTRSNKHNTPVKSRVHKTNYLPIFI